MKSLTLTIFAVLASFILITQSTADQEEILNDFHQDVAGQVQRLVKRRRMCSHVNTIIDPIAASLCPGKRAGYTDYEDTNDLFDEVLDQVAKVVKRYKICVNPSMDPIHTCAGK